MCSRESCRSPLSREGAVSVSTEVGTPTKGLNESRIGASDVPGPCCPRVSFMSQCREWWTVPVASDPRGRLYSAKFK